MAKNQKMVKNQGTPKIDFKTIKRLFKYIWANNKLKLILVFFCIIFNGLIAVLGSLFLQRLVDDLIPGIISGLLTYKDLVGALLTMASIYVIGIVSGYVYAVTMALMAQRILKDIRDEMFKKMQYLPVSYFDKNSYGDIMSVYTNDTDTLRQMVSICIPQTLSAGVSIISIFTMMLSYSVVLTFVVLGITSISMIVVKKLAGLSGKYFVAQQQSLGKTDAYIEEMINGQKVVKVFNHESKAKEGFDKINEELFNNSKKANGVSSILMPILVGIGYVLYVILAIVGCILVFAGGKLVVSIGVIVAFLTASRQFTQSINQVSNQLGSIILGLAGATRIFKLIDESPENYEGRVKLINVKNGDHGLIETNERTGNWAWKHYHLDGTISYVPLKGDVTLDNVDFTYDGKKMVLNDISLYAKPEQKIAFVGSTGAGKTTISNLLNRFYDIEDGKIRYDGININKICKQDLRRSLGVVLQDVYLFSGTIMENIRYGKLDATDEEVIEASRLANADSFIRMLPQGYNTFIDGNGSGLSQGQRQLISIARCAISDPPVMILDEATSSIDTRTEALVQKGMDQLMRGRTVFVIAHRLSTIKNSNAIVVLEKGRIIERGKHEELIENKGTYYMLYTGAFELR